MSCSLFMLTLIHLIASSKQTAIIDRLTIDFLSSQAYKSFIERHIADIDMFVDIGNSHVNASRTSDFLFSTDVVTSLSSIVNLLSQVPDDLNSRSPQTWESGYKPAINRALFDLYTDVVIRSVSGRNTDVVKLIEQLHFCFAFFSGGDDASEIIQVKYELLRQLNIISVYLAQGHATYSENMESQIGHFVQFAHYRLEEIADEVRYAKSSVEAAADLQLDTFWVLLGISRGLTTFAPLCDLEPLHRMLEAVEMWHYVSIKANIHFPSRAQMMISEVQDLVDQCISSRVL
jgi:hypothetical protein